MKDKLNINPMVAGGILLALFINAVIFIGIPFLSVATAEKPAELFDSFVSFNTAKPEMKDERQLPDKRVEENKPKKLPEMQVKENKARTNKPKPELSAPRMNFDMNASLADGMAVSMPVVEGTSLTSGMGTAFEIGEVDTPPQALFRAAPVYPFAAKRRGITGDVVLRFLVDENGQISRISVVSAEPAGVFEDAAIDAVKRWRFKAGIYDGEAVRTWVVAPFQFRI
jgi:protein TonB